MIDINIIRENPNLVREACKKKKSDPSLVDKFLDLDKEWRALVGDTDVLRAKKNNLGKDNIDEAKKIKDNLKEIEARLKVVENERDMVIEQIPNIPFDDVRAIEIADEIMEFFEEWHNKVIWKTFKVLLDRDMERMFKRMEKIFEEEEEL